MCARRGRRVAAMVGFILLAALASPRPLGAADPAPAAAPGDLWETTSQMTIPGMPMQMPAQKSKVCTPKEWKEPPAAADAQRKCVNSDFKVVGVKATWKVACEGPPSMTGEAEITRDGDTAYTGAIKFASEEMSMTVKLDGKRVGACDLSKK